VLVANTLRRVTVIGIILFLLAVTSVALYYDLNPPRKAWIFGDVYNTPPDTGTVVKLSADELPRFPTLQAYIEYIDWRNWIIPHPSWNISSVEASSLISFVRERSSQGLSHWSSDPNNEIYSFTLDVSGKICGISIAFGERPILD
jgi:hypothetical protein